MSQKRTRESSLHHRSPKSHPSQSLAMSHDETFMSHRETSNASGNSPEIRRKIGKALGNSENGRKLPVRRFGGPAIGAGSCDRAREIPKLRPWAASPFFAPSPAAARVPDLKARHSAAHGGARPAAGRDGNSAGIFRARPGRPFRPPLAMSQMGHFCLMNEPSLDATNPMSPWRTSRVLGASAVRPSSGFPLGPGLRYDHGCSTRTWHAEDGRKT